MTTTKTTKKIIANNPFSEDKAYWQNHVDQYQRSGLTGMKYCKINNLTYYRFRYWLNKFSKTSSHIPNILIPVKPITTNTLENINSSTPVAATLYLKNGCYLKIHDAQGLSFILEKMGLTC